VRLDFVQVRASDWRRSLEWWRDTLGLPVLLVDEAGGFALLDAGAARIAVKQGVPAPGGTLLAFAVSDADAWAARLGTTAQDEAEGYRRVRLADPDGYAVVLFQQAAPSAPRA
jgi:catechol 2,3-dioxygenase-like lactoylglutathione lyase family enzyme